MDIPRSRSPSPEPRPATPDNVNPEEGVLETSEGSKPVVSAEPEGTRVEDALNKNLLENSGDDLTNRDASTGTESEEPTVSEPEPEPMPVNPSPTKLEKSAGEALTETVQKLTEEKVTLQSRLEQEAAKEAELQQELEATKVQLEEEKAAKEAAIENTGEPSATKVAMQAFENEIGNIAVKEGEDIDEVEEKLLEAGMHFIEAAFMKKEGGLGALAQKAFDPENATDNVETLKAELFAQNKKYADRVLDPIVNKYIDLLKLDPANKETIRAKIFNDLKEKAGPILKDKALEVLKGHGITDKDVAFFAAAVQNPLDILQKPITDQKSLIRHALAAGTLAAGTAYAFSSELLEKICGVLVEVQEECVSDIRDTAGGYEKWLTAAAAFILGFVVYYALKRDNVPATTTA